MRPQRVVQTIGMAMLLAMAGGAETFAARLAGGAVSLSVEPDGSGFVDEMTFRNRVVCRSQPGFQGASICLLPPSPITRLEDLFTGEPTRTLSVRVTRADVVAATLRVEGRYTDGSDLAVPFQRRFTIEPDGTAIRFEETAQFDQLPPGWRVAQVAWRLPLVVTNDAHWQMFGFGCAGRAELFRRDMNDLRRRSQSLSAPRAHWPYWDLGGVLQWPESYRVWKANHADTMAYPLQEGVGAPGWADYSERDWGITTEIESPSNAAPWALTIDARAGVLTLEPWPALQPPAGGTMLRKRRLAGRWRLHDSSWPACMPCELDFETYRALLEDLDKAFIESGLGTSDADAILFRERIQPSAVLRLLYRGDAWRMQGRLAAVGIQAPRVQSFEKWEADARRYLDILREQGVPRRSKP